MKYDETIKEILYDISKEMHKEKGKEFTIEELFEICNSQFVGGAVANDLKISFFISYIGNFIFKNKQAYSTSLKEMEKLKEQVNEEEYKELIKEKRIANKKVLSSSKLKLITKLEDLPEHVTESRSLVEFNRLYKKAINKQENE